MKRLKQTSRVRKAAIVAVFVLLGTGAAIALGPRAVATSADSHLGLDPSNFAALHTPATALPGVPAAARIAPGYDPTPGTVHELGRGAALAWVAADRVCWSASGAGGCATSLPSSAQAIDPVVHDPDQIRQGKPAMVLGLAVDGVTKVTATLADGSQLSTAPIDNWYEIDLPSSAAPWDVIRIEAVTASGEVIPYDLPPAPPMPTVP